MCARARVSVYVRVCVCVHARMPMYTYVEMCVGKGNFRAIVHIWRPEDSL